MLQNFTFVTVIEDFLCLCSVSLCCVLVMRHVHVLSFFVSVPNQPLYQHLLELLCVSLWYVHLYWVDISTIYNRICSIFYQSFLVILYLLMACSKTKRMVIKASPFSRPVRIGNVSDKCLHIQYFVIVKLRRLQQAEHVAGMVRP